MSSRDPRHTCTPGLIGSAYGCPVCMPWTAPDVGETPKWMQEMFAGDPSQVEGDRDR